MELIHSNIQGGGQKYRLIGEQGETLSTVIQLPGTIAKAFRSNGTTHQYGGLYIESAIAIEEENVRAALA